MRGIQATNLIERAEESKQDAYLRGKEEAYKDFAEVIAMDIADCRRCPIDCEVATYKDCEEALIKYVKEQHDD